MSLTTGQILQGRYCIISHVGQGGMGTVYQAQDLRLGNRLTAVKEFDPAQLPLSDRQATQLAFKQEAEILARLSHPGLTAVYDYFLENNKFYLVMEFVNGENLETIWMRQGRRLPESQVIAWAQQLCNVLTYLHYQQPPIIFRDLKPSNIMVQPDNQLKLIDFGIARHFDPQKTRDTANFGTPGYAAPEQYGVSQSDPRSDVYSLGVVIHQLLTGHDPGTTPFTLPDITTFQVNVSPAVAQTVQQAVQTDPNRRPATVQQFCQMLTAVSTTVVVAPAAKRPLWPWVLGIVAVILFGLVFLLGSYFPFFSTNPTPDNPTEVVHTVIVTQVSSPTPTLIDKPTTVPTTPTLQPTSTRTTAPPPTETAVPTPEIKPSTRRSQDEQVLLYVPAGTLQMGSTTNGPGIVPTPHELPAHEVFLDAFWIDENEITNEQYAAFLNANGNRIEGDSGNTWLNIDSDFSLITTSSGNFVPKPGADDKAAVMITWYGAAAYCRWVGGSLPTEAQWEYAARGPENLIYPWGNDVGTAPLNFCDTNCKYDHRNSSFNDGYDEVGQIGSYANHSWIGALDMAGNVWEWVADWYGAYSTTSASNPTGPSSGSQRVLRGGSWGDSLNDNRSAVRQPYPPDARNGLIGFRCVMAETAVD